MVVSKWISVLKPSKSQAEGRQKAVEKLGVSLREAVAIDHMMTSLRWSPKNLLNFEAGCRTEHEEIQDTLLMFGLLAVNMPTWMLPDKVQKKIKRAHYEFWYAANVTRTQAMRRLRAWVKLNGGTWDAKRAPSLPGKFIREGTDGRLPKGHDGAV